MRVFTKTEHAQTARQADPIPEATPPRRFDASHRDPPEARVHVRQAVEPARHGQHAPILVPSRVDLVEELDSGRLYLRAFKDGRYYWQPIGDGRDGIADAGMWQASAKHHAAYWVNHGSYRRRAGRYYAITEADGAARAA